jgi:hypothetical protein
MTRCSISALFAGLLALTPALAPALAHAEGPERRNAAQSVADEAAALYGDDGSPSKSAPRTCLQEHERFLQYGTDDFAVTLRSPVKTPLVSWKKGEQHTVGQLVEQCTKALAALDAGDLLSDLTHAAIGVWQYQHKDKGAAQKCLAAYDKVHAAGIADSTALTVDSGDTDNPFGRGAHTVGEVHAYCTSAIAEADRAQATFELRNQVMSAVGGVLDNVKRANESPSFDLKDMDGQTEHCNAAVDRALADGASPDLELDGGNGAYEWHGTLARAKTEVCAQAEATRKKLYEKRFGPYLAAGLKNDKFDLLYKWYPDDVLLPGGVATIDPKKLASASVWFEVSVGATGSAVRSCSGDAEVETLTRYQFGKDQKIAKTSSKEFCGAPPKSAYR